MLLIFHLVFSAFPYLWFHMEFLKLEKYLILRTSDEKIQKCIFQEISLIKFFGRIKTQHSSSVQLFFRNILKTFPQILQDQAGCWHLRRKKLVFLKQKRVKFHISSLDLDLSCFVFDVRTTTFSSVSLTRL